MKLELSLLLLCVLLCAGLASAQREKETGGANNGKETLLELLPSLRQQDAIAREWAREREHTILPALMRLHGVDAWVLSMREYNEDPAFWPLVSRTTTFAARRRTLKAFAFNKTSGNSEDAFVSRTFVDNTPQVWADFNSFLTQFDPSVLTINIDASGNNFADGLHAGEHELLVSQLPWLYWLRLRRVPILATQFIATRPDSMLPYFKKLMRVAHAIIREGFSTDVIIPGVTTTEDLSWFFRDRIQSLNLTTWFHPSVDIQRYDKAANTTRTLSGIIEVGDFIWTDFGVTFMGMNTDTQHVGYVLREHEADVPLGFKLGLTEHSNVIQDILLKEINLNRTGNEVLKITLDEMARRNISGTVYCHPIGDYGHSAGSLIGMTNLQDGVPVLGDLPIFPNMWYSIELQANVPIPEWGGGIVNFRQEEDVYIDSHGVARWVNGRQSKIHLIGNVDRVSGDSIPDLFDDAAFVNFEKKKMDKKVQMEKMIIQD
ncbi:hypothetical protein HK100_011956 [Physocladia obscura]|uniref:Peptidase M24 domain-containing protein n=1 Tax=Physocladia obscura TaxID=109957 RepID=A0AAD5T8N6_9FUNG|nr:hypothetical protein HK100_011956 [Physocladia obscura]